MRNFKSLQKHYENQGKLITYDLYFRYGIKTIPFTRRRNVINNMLPIGQGLALDLGCGLGVYSVDIIAHAHAHEVVSLDVSRSYLYKARRLSRVKGFTDLQHFILADAQNLPFRSLTFDLIFCSEVLEHLPNHHKGLAEINRVLKLGGFLVLSTPSSFSLTERILYPWEHLHKINPIWLRRFLHLNGFLLVEEKYCNFGAYPLSGLSHYIKISRSLDNFITRLWYKFDELIGGLPLIKLLSWCYATKLIKIKQNKLH